MLFFFFFSSRRRHTRLQGDWSSDLCSTDLLRRRNVCPVCGGPRLFGGRWLLGRGAGLGVGGFCWNDVHTTFSLGGDYRNPIHHSPSQELQANSDGNPTWAEDRRRRRTTPKTSAQTVALSPNQLEYHAET